MESEIIGEKYIIEEKLGGYESVVLKVRHKDTNDIYVAKAFNREQLTKKRVRKRFDQEIEMHKGIESSKKHHGNYRPFIVPLYEVVESDGESSYLIMEYMKGGSLRGLLKERKAANVMPPITLEEVSRMINQIGRALDYAYSCHRIIHHDIKPDNILLDSDKNFYLADFGAISIPDASYPFGQVYGTVGYISPERLRGWWYITRRSDIYSLGIVAYECLGGQRPFQEMENTKRWIKAHKRNIPPKIEEQKDVVNNAVLAALTKFPLFRYRSGGEFGLAFENAIGSKPTSFRTNPTILILTTILPILLVAVLVLGIILAVAAWASGMFLATPTPTLTTPSPSSTAVPDGMVLVEPGCFVPGSTQEEIDLAVEMCQQNKDDCPIEQYEDELNQNQIQVCFNKSFWIDKYEVSNADYDVESKGFNECKEEFAGKDEIDRPVNCVSWVEAQAYCEKRGARLPTELEWEYAARGPEQRMFPWSDESWSYGDAFYSLGYQLNLCDSDCSMGWSVEGIFDAYSYTAPVNAFREGASWVGAYNMSGNVWEWVADPYVASYQFDEEENPPTPNYALQGSDSDDYRVVRGGSWMDSNLAVFRTAYRGYLPRNTHWEALGFRCVRDVEN